MAVKISELTAAGSANATDQFEANQSGTSRRVTSLQIADYVRGLAGTVLQVVQGETSTATTIAGTTWTDTGLIASITPSSASSRILVIAMTSIFIAREGSGLELTGGGTRIVRDGTPITGAGGYNSQVELTGATSLTAVKLASRSMNIYLNSPATASATTYKTQARGREATDTVYCHSFGEELSVIILVEISA